MSETAPSSLRMYQSVRDSPILNFFGYIDGLIWINVQRPSAYGMRKDRIVSSLIFESSCGWTSVERDSLSLIGFSKDVQNHMSWKQ